MDDIAYNFLIGGDGYAYEGRGFDNRGTCSNREWFNTNGICIGFIGTFAEVAPSDQQLEVVHQLIAHGIEVKKIRPDYNLYGHCQVKATDSPGVQLYSIIKTWHHWNALVQ